MGCCNLKSLPGINDNSNKFNSSNNKTNQENCDDLYLDNLLVKSLNEKNTINDNNDFKVFKDYYKNNYGDANVMIDEDYLKSNKHLFYKAHERKVKINRNSNNVNSKAAEETTNAGIIKIPFKDSNKMSIFKYADNILKLKIKIDSFILTFPYFFSYFYFDFIKDIIPEISIDLKDSRKIFKGMRMLENSAKSLDNLDISSNIYNNNISENHNIDLNKSMNDITKSNNQRLFQNNNKAPNHQKFIFEKEVFSAEIPFQQIKQNFISIYFLSKSMKDEQTSYVIGEAYIPVAFMSFKFRYNDNIIDLPIINKTENIILGYLKIDMNTSESLINESSQGEHDLESCKEYFKNYFKFQSLSIDFYQLLELENSHFNFDPLIFNKLKIRIHKYLSNYSNSPNKREEIIYLFHFINTKDLSITKDDLGKSIDTSISPEDLSNLRQSSKLKEKDYLLDIKNLCYLKYYSLLCLLNEYMLEANDQQKSSLFLDKKVQKVAEFEFLSEKIIYSPFLEIHQNEFHEDCEFDIMLITNAFFIFLCNLHEKNLVSVDSIYSDCVFILRDLASLFSKAKSYLVKLYKEDLRSNTGNSFCNTNNNNKINHITTLRLKSDILYNLIIDNIYKYLIIVNYTINIYIKELKDEYNKKSTQFKTQNRLETIKANFENLFIFSHVIFTNNIFIANSVMNLFLNTVKYGKLYSSLYHLSKIECYLNFFTDEYAKNLEWLKDAFMKFNRSHYFFKNFIELSEVLIAGTPNLIKLNYLKYFNMKLIFQRFNFEAKNLESKKFLFWNTYLNFLLNIIKGFSSDSFRMVDFYYFNYEDVIMHFSGLCVIAFNYPYFKIFSPNEISFDFETLSINRISSDYRNPFCLSQTTVNTRQAGSTYTLSTMANNTIALGKKYLVSYQSLLVFSSFLEIFYEIVCRKYIFIILKQFHKHTLAKIIDQIFFVIFYYIETLEEKHKNDINNKLFNLYGTILKILFKFQTKYKFVIDNIMKESLANIFNSKDLKELKPGIYLKKILLRLNEYKSDIRDIAIYKEIAENMISQKKA